MAYARETVDVRNHERYMDLTAYHALKNLPKGGEIWTYTKKDGEESCVVVLKNHGKTSSVLNLIDVETDETMPVLSVSMKYTNPQMVMYLYSDKLERFIKRLPEKDFQEILQAVGRALGITAEPTEEKPAAAAPATPAAEDAATTALKEECLKLKTQLGVYKTLYDDLIMRIVKAADIE